MSEWLIFTIKIFDLIIVCLYFNKEKSPKVNIEGMFNNNQAR